MNQKRHRKSIHIWNKITPGELFREPPTKTPGSRKEQELQETKCAPIGEFFFTLWRGRDQTGRFRG
jgi:hypothetical protein